MNIKQGTLYKGRRLGDSRYSFWISPVDESDYHHLENSLINIATGEIKHFSWIQDISVIDDFDEYFH